MIFNALSHRRFVSYDKDGNYVENIMLQMQNLNDRVLIILFVSNVTSIKGKRRRKEMFNRMIHFPTKALVIKLKFYHG